MTKQEQVALWVAMVRAILAGAKTQTRRVVQAPAKNMQRAGTQVIATCGECRWCHPSETCAHPKAHAEMEIDGCACAPPEWCPLRGAR